MPFHVHRLSGANIAVAAILPAASLLAAVSIAGCGGRAAGNGPTSPQRRAAAAFLRRYVRPGGRVARPDQGNDTVSEGQAYGMLLAEVAGQTATFGRIWEWTRAHLRQPNGLFAFHANAAGVVLDPEPASDADLLIAWALLRYQGPGAAANRQEGRRVAGAVLAHEVATGPNGMPILAAGPWATGRPASLNPSYWALPALRGLASITGDPRWRRLANASVALTRRLTQGGRLLPPDWAELTAAGRLRPEPAPNGSQPHTQYGLDAQRTVLWFAASCDPQARALAARWWRLLRPGGRSPALALRPDGGVLDSAPGVLPLPATGCCSRPSASSAPARPTTAARGPRSRPR